MSVPQLRRQNEDVHLNVLDGLPADHEAAIGVWRAANIARLLPPSCCRDYTSVHRKGDEAERRCGPGRRTRALDACTKARDTERQATRPHLATVAPSSSSSVKHADPRRSVVDRASERQLSAGRSNSSRIEGNAGSRKPADWYMPAPSGVALRCTTRTSVSVWNQVSSSVRHARP